jgi:hypothetical protein
MKIKMPLVLATFLLSSSGWSFAKPIKFVSEGLKNVTIVTLDVTGKAATFRRHATIRHSRLLKAHLAFDQG